jgi:hypothetical protein
VGVYFDGLAQVARDLDELSDELSPSALADHLRGPLHDAILSSMAAQRAQIPLDTGALAESLTSPRDRAHIYEVSSDGEGVVVEYGSALPQAASPAVAPRIPSPSRAELAAAVAQTLDDILEDVL